MGGVESDVRVNIKGGATHMNDLRLRDTDDVIRAIKHAIRSIK